MSIPGIAGPENVDNYSMLMVSVDVGSPSLSRSKICGRLIYDSLKSF